MRRLSESATEEEEEEKEEEDVARACTEFNLGPPSRVRQVASQIAARTCSGAESSRSLEPSEGQTEAEGARARSRERERERSGSANSEQIDSRPVGELAS